MGFKDIKSLFDKQVSRWFKFNVILSFLAFIGVITIFIIGYRSRVADANFELQPFVRLSLALFVVQIFTLFGRNFSKHKFIKAFLFIVLKLFVLFIFFFILYVFKLQELIYPTIYIT